MSISQKKVVFYPDIQDLHNEDEDLFYGFVQRDFGDPFKGENIDPEKVIYKCPDFGFNNLLNFNDPVEERKKMKSGLSNNWKYVMDFAQMEPRFERVRNYITFVNE